MELSNVLTVVDAHTEGEPFRIVSSGRASNDTGQNDAG